MTKKLLFLSYCMVTTCLFSFQTLKAQLSAGFTAKECITEVYRQGFDSTDELTAWTLTPGNISSKTWKLANPRSYAIPDFSTINAGSKYSLAIEYDTKPNQNEKMISPSFSIGDHYACSFYACFDGVYVLFANFTVDVEIISSGEKTRLLDAHAWSDTTGHERPKWLKFDMDLAGYAGKEVRFIFTYSGINGDDVLVDDFCITQKSAGENAQATIAEGASVHFEDLSTGEPTEWLWEFEEGTPSTSTLQHPVVQYNKAGLYKVKLTAKKGGESSSITKSNFVHVQGVAPVAVLSLPEEGYLSPYAGIFIPRDQLVTFKDASKNVPTSWKWELPGANAEISQEQHPKVKYANNGTYNLKLTVSNNQGSDVVDYENIIQVGGDQEIWNIGMDETKDIGSISLSWYGYYGGSNFLGMTAYGEYFKKPLVPGSISEVSVYFDQVNTVSPDSLVFVTIAGKNAEGLPGDILATSEAIMVKDLKYNPATLLPTSFKFASPVNITDEFFVIVNGIPNCEDEDTYETDEVVIAAVKRSELQKSTCYVYMEEYDEDYMPTGLFKWYEQNEEYTSFAIAPRFTYKDTYTELPEVQKRSTDAICPTLVNDQLSFYEPEKIQSVAIYSLNGKQVYRSESGQSINTSSFSEGFYIIRATGEDKVSVQKIKIAR